MLSRLKATKIDEDLIKILQDMNSEESDKKPDFITLENKYKLILTKKGITYEKT